MIIGLWEIVFVSDLYNQYPKHENFKKYSFRQQIIGDLNSALYRAKKATPFSQARITWKQS